MKVVTTKQQREISNNFLHVIDLIKTLSRVDPRDIEIIEDINLKIGNHISDIVYTVGGEKELEYVADKLMEVTKASIDDLENLEKEISKDM